MKITSRNFINAKIILRSQHYIVTTHIVFLLFLGSITNAIASSTQPLGVGLTYQAYPIHDVSPFAKIHVVDIDLKHHKFAFCDIKHPVTTQEAHKKNQEAIMVFNGGFFSTEKKPLGLRVNQGKLISKFKPISWWHVLSIKDQKAKIEQERPQQNKIKDHMFAIQAGPRLINDKKIIPLKDGLAARTALGVKEDGHIVVVISQYTQITTNYLANFMKNTLNVKDAINLDGGSSTQMSLKINGNHKNVYGVAGLPDPICVFKN